MRCEAPEEVVPHGVSDCTEMECTVSVVETPHVLSECDMTIAGNEEVNFTTPVALASDAQTLQTTADIQGTAHAAPAAPMPDFPIESEIDSGQLDYD